MKIRDCVQREYRFLSPEAPLREIARLFDETGETVLPVCEENGRLAGVITIDDFLLIFLPGYIDLIPNIDFIHDFGAIEEHTLSIEEILFVAEDLMREKVPVLDERDSLMKAAAVLHRSEIPRIPVMSGDLLIGMISKKDIVRALYGPEGHP